MDQESSKKDPVKREVEWTGSWREVRALGRIGSDSVISGGVKELQSQILSVYIQFS